jgi:hypothetical protein
VLTLDDPAVAAGELTYASSIGHGLIDRALYLPRCWTDDPDRRPGPARRRRRAR